MGLVKFEDAKPYIDTRIADVKESREFMEISEQSGFNIIVRLIELFEFEEPEKSKAMDYIKQEMRG